MTNFDTFYETIYSFKENDTNQDIEIIKRELDIQKSDKVLDLGVGYGRVFFPLMEKGYHIFGYDNSKFFKENYFKGNEKSFILGKFSEISKKIEKQSFDSIYSLYSSIGHDGRENDEKLLSGISEILKKGGKFLLEYENFVFHTQNNNIFNKSYYDIGEYRRLVDIQVDLREEKINLTNELYDLKYEKNLKKWNFSLELYTYKTLEELAKKYGLKLKKVFGRFDSEFIFWYEPQVFLLFEKI